jgi:hypothetical protein
MYKAGVSVLFSLIFCLATMAQGDLAKQYFNAKTLFREGKYNLAMESFKPLMPFQRGNPFSEYASFYYAMSAYNLGYQALAKTSFNEILTLYPNWDKADEVRYWIGKINVESKEVFQGFKVLSAIKDPGLSIAVESLKAQAVSTISETETLKSLLTDYPADKGIATHLAAVLSKHLEVEGNKQYLETLIESYGLQRSDFIPEAPKTYYKDVYAVSVILPFMANTLDPSPTPKRNQSVLDLYEGMKLAVDTLSKQGIKISLRAYDTQRNVDKIRRVLATEELKNTDLIIGPYFQEETKALADFSLVNKINILNPLHNNSELIALNPYSLLYQPTLEVLGHKSGAFLSGYVSRKNCLVFYGTSKRDSVLAANFIAAATAGGLNIVGTHRLPREASQSVLNILATPTEYDEFRYPKEFTLKKDSIGSIYVASDDALIYAKVISSIETRGDNIVVLGSESWLDQHAIALEKFQNLPIVLASPNFSASEKPTVKAFIRKYVRMHGRVPSNYSAIGYELMLFAGNQLKKNGVYFQKGLMDSGIVPGFMTEGFDFYSGASNARVPFIRFETGKMTVLENR